MEEAVKSEVRSVNKWRGINRQFIVNRKLQLTIILYSLVLSVCVSLINYVFDRLVFVQPQVLSPNQVLLVFGVVIVLVFSLVFIGGSILTNRFAGPIYRLKGHMDEVIEGKIRMPLNFRKDDYFLEIVEPYNKIMKRLHEAEEKNKLK